MRKPKVIAKRAIAPENTIAGPGRRFFCGAGSVIASTPVSATALVAAALMLGLAASV